MMADLQKLNTPKIPKTISSLRNLPPITTTERSDDDEIDELQYGHFRLRYYEQDVGTLNISNSYLSNCDLSSAKIRHIDYSILNNCKFTGSNMEQTFQDIEFKNCSFNSTLFRMSKLKRVSFYQCKFNMADFYASTMEDVRFEECEVQGIGFDQSSIKRVDLSGSKLSISDPQTLKGCRVDDNQIMSLAPEMARSLGLIIK